MARVTDFGGDCPGYVVTPNELNEFIEELTYEEGEYAIDTLSVTIGEITPIRLSLRL